MITAKFGGSAVTPANLTYVKQCITPSHNCVVVSAVGKEHAYDSKTTDLLKDYYLTRDIKIWNKISDKYRRLVEVNGINIDIDKILYDAQKRALKYNLDYCMSLGEELSAKAVAKFLSAEYIEAEQIIRFGKKNLLYKTTLNNIKQAFDGVDLGVMGGFYGGDKLSRKVFARGGSDITGSLCAAATKSSLYENWTDAYGVCVANPSKAFDVSTVYSLSYDEMFALSYAGAEVLHPDAVEPCRICAIPIKIGNFYNPYGASTLVSNCPSRSKILSVAERQDGSGNTVTTVLNSLSFAEMCRLFYEFFSENALNGSRAVMYDFSIKGNLTEITSDRSIVADLYKFLKNEKYF